MNVCIWRNFLLLKSLVPAGVLSWSDCQA